MCVFFSPRETEITISAGSGGNGRKSCWSCGIEKETKKKKKKKKKSSPAQASEAMTETSKRQLEIENTFAPAAASHT